MATYIVQGNDNYDVIARRYGVDMQALMKLNNYIALLPGMSINVPNLQMAMLDIGGGGNAPPPSSRSF